MFDILVYLFESYIHADACPESDLLARKLSAAGFEEEEISEALEWLAGLRRVAREIHPGVAPDARSVRIYTEYEQAHLSAECRGFLALMEAQARSKAYIANSSSNARWRWKISISR